MKIFEVTHKANVKEAAPGSFAAKAGVFGKAFGNALGKQMFGVDLAKNAAKTPGKIDTGQLDPIVQQVAKSMVAPWTQSVSQVMGVSPNPVTRSPGVTDFKQIDQTLLDKALTVQIDNLVNSLSKGTYKTVADLQTITALVGQENILRIGTNNIKSAMDTIKKSDPSAVDLTKTFAQMIKSINILSRMSSSEDRAKGVTDADIRNAEVVKTPDGKIMFNGELLDPKTNPAHQTILTQLYAAGKLK